MFHNMPNSSSFYFVLWQLVPIFIKTQEGNLPISRDSTVSRNVVHVEFLHYVSFHFIRFGLKRNFQQTIHVWPN